MKNLPPFEERFFQRQLYFWGPTDSERGILSDGEEDRGAIIVSLLFYTDGSISVIPECSIDEDSWNAVMAEVRARFSGYNVKDIFEFLTEQLSLLDVQ